MQQVTIDQLEQVARILGSHAESEHDAAVTALLGNEFLARRAIDWLAEAFGLVLIQHIAAVKLPRTFKAQNRDGEWVEIPFTAEPIFGLALRLGTAIYHSGPREIFSKIALRSALVSVVNKALNSGANLEGAELSSPSMLGLKAETYVNH
jgi:hypothetical protein